MKLKLTLLPVLFLLSTVSLFAQQPPAEFFRGLEALSSNRKQAKADMLAVVEKMPAFHGSYHFLGVIYSEAGQQDSAIYFLEKAVSLNTANINKTKEMSIARLIDAYSFNNNFDKAYQTGWAATNSYPENKSIAINFKDACIWSYYIKHTGLDKSYLSPVIRETYEVTSIPQEYLIIRRLMHEGEYIQTSGQKLQEIKNSSYDVHTWKTKKDSKERELKFKLNWDMNKEFGGKAFPKDPVVADNANPIYERVGALLVNDPKTDHKAAISKMGN